MNAPLCKSSILLFVFVACVASSVAACGEDDPGPAGCGCDFFDVDCPDSPVPASCEGQPKASASASSTTPVSTWSK